MKNEKQLNWEYQVPFFKNTFILKSVVKTIGIAIGALFILILAIFLIEANLPAFVAILPWLLLTCFFVFLLALLAAWLVLGNKYSVRYTIDKEGAHMIGTKGHLEGMARTTAIVGFLKRNPTVADAGLMAKDSDGYMLAWEDVRSIDYSPAEHKIQLVQSPFIQMQIFCPKELFKLVEETVQSYYPNKSGQ